MGGGVRYEDSPSGSAEQPFSALPLPTSRIASLTPELSSLLVARHLPFLQVNAPFSCPVLPPSPHVGGLAADRLDPGADLLCRVTGQCALTEWLEQEAPRRCISP